MTCARAQEFLGRKKATPTTIVDAKKRRYDEAAALALIKDEQIDEIYAAKGKAVIHLDMKASRPSRAEIVAAIIGPSGNLRAPVLRSGRRLFVGFNEEQFASLLV